MSKSLAPRDLLKGYDWMRRTVKGIETQSIPTTQGSYGGNARYELSPLEGWETGKHGETDYTAPFARVLADQVTILGAVQWTSGVSNKAILLPALLTPFEEYTYYLHRDDGTAVWISIKPDGYVRIPPGENTSATVLTLRYPMPRAGG